MFSCHFQLFCIQGGGAVDGGRGANLGRRTVGDGDGEAVGCHVQGEVLESSDGVWWVKLLLQIVFLELPQVPGTIAEATCHGAAERKARPAAL